ncbi:hypothetical protein JOF28_000431 [Leucobacter exalbidus]|uniref:DUF3093 domain-containing protein n=1 Tax=Leucobacter exalbidus TaxID=662960 RepID=A0A940T310_9MICO|nr:DUF3093 domain-containing protein [Leucobacter exalbidus]MBP1325199.1 hypothetical protein [Leucobacter exalbidus]
MTSDSAATPQQTTYRERLVPGPGIFVALVLAIPAVALVITPIESGIAWPVGIAVYLIAVITLLLLAPVVTVQGGTLTAGHASIPVAQLGEAEALGSEGLRQAIGPGLDARTFMLVRGWIHRGVRIENIDPADPAPHWIITTRHPQKLIDAIQASK